MSREQKKRLLLYNKSSVMYLRSVQIFYSFRGIGGTHRKYNFFPCLLLFISLTILRLSFTLTCKAFFRISIRTGCFKFKRFRRNHNLFCLFSFTDEFIQHIVTRGNETARKIFFIGYSFSENKNSILPDIIAIFFIISQVKYPKN